MGKTLKIVIIEFNLSGNGLKLQDLQDVRGLLKEANTNNILLKTFILNFFKSSIQNGN